ncbi:sugar phosphate isomerase/epimerase family protein [Mucilaginibacter gilvus]|uniref:Sugar phosphate isomerase/epimerase n=1 Tax=Mucilaginibacter gilvus TaxID=2305909 RepID=A0A444MNE7_9SPHI|nr:sugar phosphate isomerase/epimerase family protein [Mucilaginibacter gilvus]RWY51222.1 sugar phosphate isomerase/epimerase [Mucilaginibacter gilvus]
MEKFPFPIGISEFTTQPWTFEQDVERYAEAGIAMIEVCEEKLDDRRYPEQMAMVKSHGLAVCAVQPLVRTFGYSQIKPEPKELSARVSRLRTSIERLSPFARGCPFIVNTGAPEKENVHAMIDTTIRELRSLAGFAADHGVKLALEPLNASSMNTESSIWTINQALKIIDAVNRDNVGLCLDLWNSWQDADVESEIRRAAGRIFALQVSDWRTPRSGGDRLVPGDGVIPIGKLLRAVQDTRYTGACTVEIFSNDVTDSLYKTDLYSVILQSKRGLADAWSHTDIKL